MAVQKLKIILVGVIALGGLVASIAIRHQAQAQLRLRQERLDWQNSELTSLAKNYERLSNLVLHARCSATNLPPRDDAAEMSKLRNEAATLRDQRIELAKARHPDSNLSDSLPSTPPPSRASSTKLYGVELVVSSSDSEQYKHEFYKIGAASPHFGPLNIDARKDAQNLGNAVYTYAVEHQGEIPSNFEVAAPYFLKGYRVPNANEYEIVYQGSVNDLTGIPRQAVALVRERQPWPTPAGKLGRLYVMANGFVRIVESDDNFRSWEAEHVVPPGERLTP